MKKSSKKNKIKGKLKGFKPIIKKEIIEPKEEKKVSLGWDNQEITPITSRNFEDFPIRRVSPILQPETIEPVRDLEIDLENVQTSQTQIQDKPYTSSNASLPYTSTPSYEQIPKERDLAMPNVTLANPNLTTFQNSQQTINPRQFEQQFGYPEQEEDSYQHMRKATEEEDRRLPFQRKRRF
ncbi:MAG: hypothetical protein WC438_04180 [Candidatus Pacearchaeota archaeon]